MALAPRLADLGWHLQVLTGAAKLAPLRQPLGALPVDVVIDHMALPTCEADLAVPGFGAAVEGIPRDITPDSVIAAIPSMPETELPDSPALTFPSNGHHKP